MITHDKIVKAVLKINSDAKFVVRDEVVEWLDGTTPIPVAEIEAKMVEVQAEYDANQYQRDRVYPSIQEQLDMQYWDKVNGTTNWEDAIAKVKADTPKP
jgi:hypothetical protein